MAYVVERYLPGLSKSELLCSLDRVHRAAKALRREGKSVRYMGSTIILEDEACFCQFVAQSEAVVAEANRRAGARFDRIVPVVVVRPTRRGVQ